MALIKCKECGSEVSNKAKACPKCGAGIGPTHYNVGWIFLGLFVVIGIAVATSGNREGTAPAPAAATAPPAPATPQWSYSSAIDPMAKGKYYIAEIDSNNTVTFGFPYGGAQRATLNLRTHPRWGKDVFLQIERGQFLCRSYEDCTVLVRFDDSAPAQFTGRGPEDNSTTAIFIHNYAGFISRMMKAKTVRISTNVYQQGAPVFEFTTAGFNADRYIPKSK